MPGVREMKCPLSWQSLVKTTYYLVPGLVLSFIWIPVIAHYYIPNVVITDEMLNTARRSPSDQILNELRGFRFFGQEWADEGQLIRAAEKLLRGEVDIPGSPAVRIKVPFAAGDLDKELSGWQLLFAQFTVPETLLSAYRVSGRNEFIRAARDIILGFALYERRSWLPKGLLWNEHAIAERILVLAEFWRLFRNHPDYQPEAAKAVLELVARSSRFLADPAFFAFNTNHGIMQNLALWHFCLAFPTLPNVEQYKQLAFNRMRDQLTFYVTDEGVVLEHSASYQKAGVQFLSMAWRYLTLMNTPVPNDWIEKYEEAKDFYAQLRRPDGSLPMFGDTVSSEDDFGPFVTSKDGYGQAKVLEHQKNWTPPRQTNSLDPVAGYSIWWDGLDHWPNMQELAQTVVAWSYFPGHAHKHADELSVLFWAGGQTWWTNVGYWPFESSGRSGAVSWDGSNAPHLIDEATDSTRDTRLRSFGWSNNIAAIDLERSGPQKYAARRQLLHLQPNLWMVIDCITGKGKSQTIWTTAHNVNLIKDERVGFYNLKVENILSSLTVFVSGSKGTQIKQLKGSFAPFAGWEVVDWTNEPTSAIVIEYPAEHSWSLVLWSLNNGASSPLQITGTPQMTWKDAEDWKIMLPIQTGAVNIWRDGEGISVRDVTGERTEALKLTKTPDLTERFNRLRDGYMDVANKYRPFRDLFGYRIKATWLLVFMFVAQEIALVFYKRIGGRHYINLRTFTVLSWTVGGGVLVMFFDALVRFHSQG